MLSTALCVARNLQQEGHVTGGSPLDWFRAWEGVAAPWNERLWGVDRCELAPAPNQALREATYVRSPHGHTHLVFGQAHGDSRPKSRAGNLVKVGNLTTGQGGPTPRVT